MRTIVVIIAGAMACGRGGANDGGRPRPGAPAKRDGGATPPPPAIDGGGAAAAPGGGPPGSGGVVAASDPTTMTCPDPIAGMWIAKTFADRVGRWHEHRLTITRQGDDYVATQTTRMWNGGADATFPPPCPAGGPDWEVVEMADEVEWREGVLRVWGTSVTSQQNPCTGGATSYNLDSFTGRLRRNTFDAVNNDGRDAVDRPYRFRRIACAP